jgi:hypothetical protein
MITNQTNNFVCNQNPESDRVWEGFERFNISFEALIQKRYEIKEN